MDDQAAQGDLEVVGLLNDAVRRRVYEFVAQQATTPVTREEVCAAVGISRTLAAYHLDKLAAAGLVKIDYARTSGRTGPGAGRPAKRYAWTRREVSVSFPPRNYSLLAQILASAADDSGSDAVRAAISAAATQQGVMLGCQAGDIMTALTTAGYEPEVEDDGLVVLRNCPFHSIVAEHTELVCGLNQAFVRGSLEGSGDDPDRARLSPREGRCCVVVDPGADGAGLESTPGGRPR